MLVTYCTFLSVTLIPQLVRGKACSNNMITLFYP